MVQDAASYSASRKGLKIGDRGEFQAFFSRAAYDPTGQRMLA
jgi:hypothetical protein